MICVRSGFLFGLVECSLYDGVYIYDMQYTVLYIMWYTKGKYLG